MKRIFSMAVVVGMLVVFASMLRGQDGTPVEMGVKNFGAPVYCWDKLNVKAGSLYLSGVAITTTNTFGGNLTVGNLTVATNESVAGTLLVGGAATLGSTLMATGVVTMVVAPKLTVVTAPGATTLTLTNGPTVTAAASPVYINVTIGSTTYVVPAWAK